MIGANGQAVVLMILGGKPVEIDAAISDIVYALNRYGLKTVASCSGHGYRPGNIALADGREIIIARDFAEARKIDALFPNDINGNPKAYPRGSVRMAYNRGSSCENDYEAAIWLTEGALVRAAALNALRACKVSEEVFAAVASATYAVLRTKQEAENAEKTPAESGGNPPTHLNVKV